MEQDELKKTGTTIASLKCKDGVVIGSEHRATSGTMIAHKVAKKIFRIDDHLALATAGLIGDVQALARIMQAEAELYKLRTKQPIPVRGVSTLLSNLLNQTKYMPYYVQLILSGVDDQGGHVYSIDAAGGSVEDVYTTAGSGSPYVFGVFEDNYREEMPVDEGIDLVIRGITVAMKRDSASGNGLSVCKITPERKFEEISEEEINKRMKKLKVS